MKISIDNLKSQVRALAQEDKRFVKKSSDAPGAVYSSVWVADCGLSGDKWSAIVQGMDSKFYEVGFELDEAGKVTSLGQADEVQQDNRWVSVDAHAAASEVSLVEGKLPTNLQWMPPGKQIVQPVGFPEPFEMLVTPAIAKAADQQLQQMLALHAEGKDVEPYIDINHEDNVRAFLPKKIVWGGDDAKNGGIRVEGKWTGGGAKAAEAGEQNCISPSWTLNKVTKAFIGIKHNLGGLVPRSAFHSIQAFAKAADSGQQKEQQQQENTMTDKDITDAIAKGIEAGLRPFETRIATIEANAKDGGAFSLRLKALEDQGTTMTQANAKATVEEIGVRGGRIGAQDTATVEFWTQAIAKDVKAVDALKKMTVNPAFVQIVQNGGAGTSTAPVGEHEFVAKAKAYGDTNKITNVVEAQAKFAATKEGGELYRQYCEHIAPTKRA